MEPTEGFKASANRGLRAGDRSQQGLYLDPKSRIVTCFKDLTNRRKSEQGTLQVWNYPMVTELIGPKMLQLPGF